MGRRGSRKSKVVRYGAEGLEKEWRGSIWGGGSRERVEGFDMGWRGSIKSGGVRYGVEGLDKEWRGSIWGEGLEKEWRGSIWGGGAR